VTDRGELARLQRWMQAVVTHPGGVEAGVAAGAPAPGALAEIVLPSPALAPLRQLGIYAGMIRARFRECLAEDFPALRHLVGAARFDRLADAYVQACPSRHPDLEALGARLPRWLHGEGRALAASEPAADLADLERTLLEVFHAPEAEVLGTDELLAVPRERWAAARFRPVPAFRLRSYAHPVVRYLEQYRAGQSPRPPEPAPTDVVVHRRDLRVRWFEPTGTQRALLEGLVGGAALGEALERALAAGDEDPAAVLADVGSWFEAWTAAGLFRAPLEVG